MKSTTSTSQGTPVDLTLEKSSCEGRAMALKIFHSKFKRHIETQQNCGSISGCHSHPPQQAGGAFGAISAF
jgi:hypothetical protein